MSVTPGTDEPTHERHAEGLCVEEANRDRRAALADPRRLDRCSSRVETGRGGERGGPDGGGIVLDGGGARQRAAASTSRRSRTNNPTWTRASTTTSTSGRTNANSTVADPTDPRSLRGIGVPDDRIDDVVEERGELARRARPCDQDHRDGGGGKDHERVLRRRLPSSRRRNAVVRTHKAIQRGRMNDMASPPLSGWTGRW